MPLFSLEHSLAAYLADFVLYALAIVALAALLWLDGPRQIAPQLAALALFGLAAWTLVEYLLHRFVLHGLQPFSRWHTEHHDRPTALICSPTLFSAGLILGLVFLPSLFAVGLWRACALTLGIVTGYSVYALTHHATHHWHAGNAWTRQLKRWHARHHSRNLPPGHYGVTSGFWDRVFGSAPHSTPV